MSKRTTTFRWCAAWMCHEEISLIDSDLPLCERHLAQAWAAYENHISDPPKLGLAGVPKDATTTVTKRPDPSPVVYYVRMNGFIKIGTTVDIERRMKEFYAQPCDLIAVEPGGVREEKARHAMLAPYRVGSTELFIQCRLLDELIESLTAGAGDPWKVARSLNYPEPQRTTVPVKKARRLHDSYVRGLQRQRRARSL